MLRLLGYSRAAELLFSADVIDAATAAESGLVSQVVPRGDLLRHAMEMAASAQALCHLTDDHLESVAAILENRQPGFRDA